MSQNTKNITLLGDANIYEIEQLTRQLKGALDDAMMSGEPLEVDLGQLGDVDATFCQLLSIVKAEADKDGLALSFINSSALLIEVSEALEMADFLGLAA